MIAAGSVVLAAMAMAAPAQAQSAGNGFLFKVPRGSFTVRGGFNHAFAEGDVVALATDQLTLDRGDFSAFTIGGDLAFRISPRVDAMLGAEYAGKSTPSEYRDFVDQDNRPIQQTTKFERVPLTVGLRYFLAPRGRSVGRFAWVPSSWAPYIGVGAGAMWYRFQQRGDFIDDSLNVFTDAYSSSGFAPEAHAMVGTELSLSPWFALTGEARYTWSTARPGDDFVGYDKIDLSGIAATAGLSVRF